MQRKAIKIDLKLNNKRVQVGHQFLEDISRNIDDIKENTELFELLATSNNPEVRESISRNNNLNKKTVDMLLGDDYAEVITNLLYTSDAKKHISQKQLMKIIKSGNVTFLCKIAYNVDDYVKCDLCKIVKILANHENPSVRFSLLERRVSKAISTKILKKLIKDEDMNVSLMALEEYDSRMS